jgi:hypothetical protein
MMSDDTDDKLPDPAQVVQPEPRSAVEAAADPAHGGGVVADAFASAKAQGWDVNDFQPSAALSAARAQVSAPRTIVSGVERVKAAVADAEATLGEFEDFVSRIGGDVWQIEASEAAQGTTTVEMVHFAASLVEGVGSHVADLLKRAKAAHG